MAFKTTAELQRTYEQRSGWRQIKVGECPLCGLSKAQEPDEDWWLEELALLAEATLL